MPHPDVEAEAETLAETAYAKVNVALHVRRRRVDDARQRQAAAPRHRAERGRLGVLLR